MVDIVAMTFGQPLLLFPALVGSGALTTGILTAAVAAGTFASSLFSEPVVLYRWHGWGIDHAVQAYGAAIFLFCAVLLSSGFSPTSEKLPNAALIVAACITLALSSAADNVSSIYRNTMMQAAVPDAMRGACRGCSSWW